MCVSSDEYSLKCAYICWQAFVCVCVRWSNNTTKRTTTNKHLKQRPSRSSKSQKVKEKIPLAVLVELLRRTYTYIQMSANCFGASTVEEVCPRAWLCVLNTLQFHFYFARFLLLCFWHFLRLHFLSARFCTFSFATQFNCPLVSFTDFTSFWSLDFVFFEFFSFIFLFYFFYCYFNWLCLFARFSLKISLFPHYFELLFFFLYFCIFFFNIFFIFLYIIFKIFLYLNIY